MAGGVVSRRYVHYWNYSQQSTGHFLLASGANLKTLLLCPAAPVACYVLFTEAVKYSQHTVPYTTQSEHKTDF